jgi:hypothetical protein
MIVCILMLAVPLVSNAQIHLGATTSVNITAVLDEGLSEDPRYNESWTFNVAPIGFQFGWDISKGFGLQLESILANQNQLYEIVDVAENAIGSRKLDMSYLQLPLMMKFMGKGGKGTRGNFSLGPQLSVLLDAVESYEIDEIGALPIPDDPNWELPDGSVDNGDGTYTPPLTPETDIYTKAAGDFANTQFQIAGAFGLDIDLSKHLMLTSQVRFTYSLTDMRNQDVYDAVINGNSQDVISSSANVAIGIQLGIHYYIGSTRSFKGK